MIFRCRCSAQDEPVASHSDCGRFLNAMTTITQSTNQKTTERTKAKPGKEQRPRKQPPFHVILLDDDDHTYEYVVGMLRKLFGCTTESAFQLACEVDDSGRVIVETTTFERAELKRDQIHSFGRDWRLTRCEGSMSATIEPAPS